MIIFIRVVQSNELMKARNDAPDFFFPVRRIKTTDKQF